LNSHVLSFIFIKIYVFFILFLWYSLPRAFWILTVFLKLISESILYWLLKFVRKFYNTKEKTLDIYKRLVVWRVAVTCLLNPHVRTEPVGPMRSKAPLNSQSHHRAQSTNEQKNVLLLLYLRTSCLPSTTPILCKYLALTIYLYVCICVCVRGHVGVWVFWFWSVNMEYCCRVLVGTKGQVGYGETIK
jgi:hypothetical protein